MKILFDVARGYLILNEPKEEEGTVKLELPKHLKQAKVPYWEVVVSHKDNDYQVGDKVILKPEAKNNLIEVPLPTTDGDNTFIGIVEDLVLGKVLENGTL